MLRGNNRFVYDTHVYNQGAAKTVRKNPVQKGMEGLSPCPGTGKKMGDLSIHITFEKNEAVQIMPIEYPARSALLTRSGRCCLWQRLLTQLEEEASELAQAALKYRRTLSNANPTPVTRRQAEDKLLEEIADVKLCLHVAGFEAVRHKISVNRIISSKAERWLHRLEEKR